MRVPPVVKKSGKEGICPGDILQGRGLRLKTINKKYWPNGTYVTIKTLNVVLNNKRLCYCRGTARRATSIEILWPFF